MSGDFRKGWDAIAESTGSQQGGAIGHEYIDNVQSEIDRWAEGIKEVANPKKGLDYVKGDLAEPWHGGSLGVDAARRGIDVSVEVPRDTSPVDVRGSDGQSTFEAQIKYYKDGDATAKAISHPAYDGQQKVVPADQLDDVRAAAHRLALKNEGSRPEQAHHYRDTAERADDKLHIGDAESRPMSEHDARDLAKDLRAGKEIDRDRFGMNTENVVQWDDVFRQAAHAGAQAMFLGAAIQASPHIISFVKKAVTDGELDLDELKAAGTGAIVGGLRSGLAGALSAGITASCRAGLITESLRNVNPSVVAGAVVLAIRGVGYAIEAASGDISWGEMSIRLARDTVVVCGGTAGSLIGQVLIPVPILGAVIGSLVGSVVAGLLYQGLESVCVSVLQDTGWTLFGIVKQDYLLPDDVLRSTGWQLLQVEKLNVQYLNVQKLDVMRPQLELVKYRVLRRGVLEFGRIGYI